MTDFTYQELDDLDSCISDSETLTEEDACGKPPLRAEVAYLARLQDLRRKISNRMHELRPVEQ